MRPTVKDLAKAAGVGLTTVDRVLNGRQRVSAETVRKVTEAIEQIGFVRNMAAVSLVKNKIYNFRFVLPDLPRLYIGELVKNAEAAALDFKADAIVLDVDRIPPDPHVVARHLASLGSGEVDGVAVMAEQSPQVRDAMTRLNERGIRVVQFLTGQDTQRQGDVISVDNVAAGATAASLIGRFVGRRAGRVLVVADSLNAHDCIRRRLGFDQVLQSHFPVLEPTASIETHGGAARARQAIAEIFRHHDDIVAVYVMSSDAEIIVPSIEAVMSLDRLTIVAHERTPFSEAALRAGTIAAVLAQDPGHVVRSAIRVLKARAERRPIITAQERIKIEILLRENLDNNCFKTATEHRY